MNKVFTKSLKVLIIVLLLLAVLIPKDLSQKLMIAAVLVWLLVLLTGGFTKWILSVFKSRPLSRFYCRFLLPAGKRIGCFFRGFNPPEASVETNEQTPTGLPLQAESCGQPAESGQNLPNIQAGGMPNTTAFQESSSVPQKDPGRLEKENELMLRHIALRITDKLKSAYPQAVWQWREKPSLSSVLAGDTVRICVENMAQYTHADISFDRFGRIHIEPMVIGEFIPEEKSDGSATEETTSEPPVVDVRVWYELIGQQILEEQITDLNANGHSRLTVKENGDIVITRQKKEVFRAHLEAFPPKSYWPELLNVLNENELKGKISGNQLQISWI